MRSHENDRVRIGEWDSSQVPEGKEPSELYNGRRRQRLCAHPGLEIPSVVTYLLVSHIPSLRNQFFTLSAATMTRLSAFRN